jgi:hypothetical protein
MLFLITTTLIGKLCSLAVANSAISIENPTSPKNTHIGDQDKPSGQKWYTAGLALI